VPDTDLGFIIMIKYYNRVEFKEWLIREKANKDLLAESSAKQYPTYVGYIFYGRALTKKERRDFSSAMEMYQEFIKTIP